MLVIEHDGEGLVPRIAYRRCGASAVTGHAVVAAPAPELPQRFVEGYIVHRQCINGNAMVLLGVRRCLQWQLEDFLRLAILGRQQRDRWLEAAKTDIASYQYRREQAPRRSRARGSGITCVGSHDALTR